MKPVIPIISLALPVAAAEDLGRGPDDGGCAFPDDEDDDVEETLPKPELEDCSRVLTTSRGHVMTAPVVPATLKERGEEKG